MSIFLENECDFQFDFDEIEIANKVIEQCLDYVNFPFEVHVEITLVNNETIKEINKEHRGIDKATDVLSFPMLNYPSAGDFSMVEDDESNFDMDDGCVVLGDIVISVERMREQALEYGHSQLREFAFLIVHSMLHLFGYDHETQEEEKIMFLHQKNILDECGITR